MQPLNLSPLNDNSMPRPPSVSRAEWLIRRKQLLLQEKELTRLRDQINAERRRLPMVEIDKSYIFQTPHGEKTLVELFEGRPQLVIYHFMFDPGSAERQAWTEGCPSCSYFGDSVGHLAHLQARGVSFAMVSRARLEQIEPFKRRMGWTMPWHSSFGSDFNFDFHVTTDAQVQPVEYNYQTAETLLAKGEDYHLAGEQHGLSVFLRHGQRVFHTYSTYGRGPEPLLWTNTVLDLTPYGRCETWEDSPVGWPQQPTYPMPIKHHDRYADLTEHACCRPESA